MAIEEKVVQAAPPIFVVGAPRSGTTLTARILGRHSRIFMPGETHFFDDIYSRRHELGDLANAESRRNVIDRLSTLYGRYDETSDQQRIERLLKTGADTLTTCLTYKAMFSRFMELQMKQFGKKRWGNNVPKDIFHVEDILSFYREAKFIVCVRDVRDFLLSYKNKWRTTGETNADRVRRLYHPIITSLLWRATVAQISRLRDLVRTENVLILKYENLVYDAEKAARELCQFLGEDFEPDMLNIDAENSSFEINEKGIYSASVGRWRSLLPREEVYLAELITGKRLLDFGYSPEKLKVDFFKTACLWATLPYGLWQAFRANRAIRGPMVPYVVRRFSALCSSRFAKPRTPSQEIKISV
jgi:hypothetical protein